MKIQFLLLLPLTALGADPALTIYNQNFAVVREKIPLELKAGVNEVKFADISVHLEPESVILRDPSGRVVGRQRRPLISILQMSAISLSAFFGARRNL